jgi:RHS repeat-associated protein
MSKTVNGTTTSFAWDLSGNLPVLITAGADSYIDGPGDQPFEQVTNSTATYPLADQQGSIRLLCNAAGKVTGTYTYSPYGALTRHTGSASTALRFDGEYTDAETGYQYLQARYYDPATGQFISVGPEVSLTSQACGLHRQQPAERRRSDWAELVEPVLLEQAHLGGHRQGGRIRGEIHHNA